MLGPQSSTPGFGPTAVSLAELIAKLERHTQLVPLELACRADAGDDVLNYLAENGGTATRAAVAANAAAPEAANRLLCIDAETDVRAELAQKIARLLPGLTREDTTTLRDSCMEFLSKLAQDQVPRVRAILAEEIKRLDCVPKTVVDGLARDTEAIVAVPILEFSPLLSDCDLIEIIAGTQVDGILTAIARRHPLSENVSDAVVCSLDVPALVALLTNRDAAIRADTLYKIADSAEKLTALHELLVLRTDLSARTIRRLASFVGAGLLDRLAARDGLDDATSDILHQRLLKRLHEDDSNPGTGPPTPLPVSFDEEAVERAAKFSDKTALIRELSIRAGVPAETVHHILDLRSAGPIVALVWKAGLSMRIAYLIQIHVMHLSPDECIPARKGKDFPFTKEKLRWELGVFGIR